jgi:hypothetical protein
MRTRGWEFLVRGSLLKTHFEISLTICNNFNSIQRHVIMGAIRGEELFACAKSVNFSCTFHALLRFGNGRYRSSKWYKHVSAPMQVSGVEITASPIGTFVLFRRRRIIRGR